MVVGCTGKDRRMSVRAAPGVKLYTVAQVAVMMSISESQVWSLVRSGELESIKIGWSRRVTAEGVDAFIRKQAQAADGAR